MASNAPTTKRPSYSQSTDSTLAPLMRSDESIVGERAAEGQLKKQRVKAEDVRVRAKPSSETRRNEGLHEVIPTSMRNDFGGSSAMAYTQSGLRTSPSFTVFRRDDGELGGHTQTFVKETGRGSTHTKGQKGAHDELRDEFRRARENSLSEMAVPSAMMSRQIQVTVSGPEIMKSDYLTGALPNLSVSTGALESPSATAQPRRIAFAKLEHDVREQAKERWNAHSQQEVPSSEKPLIAPPSPMRAPLNDDGSGGDYLSAPFPLPQIPTFPTDQRAAHVSGWLSQPLRSEKDKT